MTTYEITVQIPDGKYCMTLKKVADYVLCPFLVTLEDGASRCPFEHDEYLHNTLKALDAGGYSGGVIKSDACPSLHKVKPDEMDFWTYQKLQVIKQKAGGG